VENPLHAMVLNRLRTPLEWTEIADRQPGPNEILVKVAACGVCRTDLHVVDGELADPHVPIIPGHEIVGRIELIGSRRGTRPAALRRPDRLAFFGHGGRWQ